MADLKKAMITEIERWINLHELESKEIEDLKAINHTLSESYHKSQGKVRELTEALDLSIGVLERVAEMDYCGPMQLKAKINLVRIKELKKGGA